MLSLPICSFLYDPLCITITQLFLVFPLCSSQVMYLVVTNHWIVQDWWEGVGHGPDKRHGGRKSISICEGVELIVAGFIRGLIGVRSSPLTIFFLFHRYPRKVVCANSVLSIFSWESSQPTAPSRTHSLSSMLLLGPSICLLYSHCLAAYRWATTSVKWSTRPGHWGHIKGTACS